MKILLLNTDKIDAELSRLGKNRSWLANQIDISRQAMSRIMKDKPITQAERIGKALGIEPRDLIK